MTLLTRQSIELRGVLSPVIRVMAWRLGDWAVHEMPDMPGRWCLTLLPLGQCLPTDWASFAKRSQAVAAMVEIARLKNGWHRVTQDDLTKEMKARLQEICRRRGALKGPVGFCAPAGINALGAACAPLNRYAQH